MDLIENREIHFLDDTGAKFEVCEISDEYREKTADLRHILVEKAAESSEVLLERYLESGHLSSENILEGIRTLTIAGEIVPVLCGSAFKNKGVQSLLDAVLRFLPSPLDIGEVSGLDAKTGDAVVRKLTEEERFSALAFKVQTDPFVGKLTYLRIYSGKLMPGSYVYN